MDLFICKLQRGTSARNHQFPSSISPNIVIFCFLKKDIKKLLNGVTVGLSDDLDGRDVI